MIALALLAMTQAVPLVPTPTPVPEAAPIARSPIDWAALPALPYRQTPQPTAAMAGYVLAEIRRTGCPYPIPGQRRAQLRVDVAVLIGENQLVRATTPRAIGCPTVEQYSAGLVVSYARGNLLPHVVAEGGWYRATLLFDWVE